MNSFKLFLCDVLKRYFFDGIFGFFILFLSLIDNRIGAFPDRFDK